MIGTPVLAEYTEWTSSSDNVPDVDEACVRVDCAECDTGETLLSPRESKADGSVADTAHEWGWPCLSVICGDGCAGEDAIHNSWSTLVTL